MNNLDHHDKAILLELQRDSRQTYAEIGASVGLSAASVHSRVKTLEKRGIIKGFSARVDARALGLPVLAFVSVRTDGSTSCFLIAPTFKQFSEIEECYSVAGDTDIMLKVRTNTPEALEELLYRVKQIPGVSRTNTVVTLSTAFEHQPLIPSES